MRRLLSRILAVLLASVLLATALAWVASQTIMRPSYITQSAQQSGFYTQVATVLPEAIAGRRDGQVYVLLSQIISPGLVEQRLAPAVDQAASYYHGRGPAPTLDLTDIAGGIKLLGASMPMAGILAKPFSLGSPGVDSVLIYLVPHLELVIWAGPAAAAVIALIMLGLLGAHRWKALAGAAAVAAALTALAGGVAMLAPALLSASVGTSNWAPFRPAVHALIVIISAGVTSQLLWWAVGYAAGAVLLFGVALVVSLRGHRSKGHHQE